MDNLPFERERPDILLFADIHLHERNEFKKIDPVTGLNSRLSEGLSILDQIINICKLYKTIDSIICLGDIFEIKDRIPNHIILEFKKRVDIMVGIGLHFLVLQGNHDYSLPEYPILKAFDGDKAITSYYKFYFISKPGQDHYLPSNTLFWWIPFQRKEEDFISLLNEANERNPDYVLFHQEIPGAEYESGKKSDFTIKPTFKKNTIYLSGHIHKPQKVNGVQYLGSPYPTKFSQYKGDRFLWLLNSANKKLFPIKVDYPEFIDIDITSDNVDKVKVEGNYIRLVGDQIYKQDWTDEVKKEWKEYLYARGAKGVSFQIEIIKPNKLSISEKGLEQDDNVIIKKYVEEMGEGINLNKEKLTEIGLNLLEN